MSIKVRQYLLHAHYLTDSAKSWDAIPDTTLLPSKGAYSLSGDTGNYITERWATTWNCESIKDPGVHVRLAVSLYHSNTLWRELSVDCSEIIQSPYFNAIFFLFSPFLSLCYFTNSCWNPELPKTFSHVIVSQCKILHWCCPPMPLSKCILEILFVRGEIV